MLLVWLLGCCGSDSVVELSARYLAGRFYVLFFFFFFFNECGDRSQICLLMSDWSTSDL